MLNNVRDKTAPCGIPVVICLSTPPCGTTVVICLSFESVPLY